jgi:hypothetical protein
MVMCLNCARREIEDTGTIGSWRFDLRQCAEYRQRFVVFDGKRCLILAVLFLIFSAKRLLSFRKLEICLLEVLYGSQR